MADQESQSADNQSGSAENENAKRGVWSRFFKGRLSKPRAATFTGAGLFMFTVAGFYYNNRHAPPWVAVGVFTIGGVIFAFGVRQLVINFKHSDTTANVCCIAVIVFTTIFMGIDLFFEYWPQPHVVPARKPDSFGVFVDGLDIKAKNEIWSINLPAIGINIKNLTSNTIENVWVNFIADTDVTNLEMPGWDLQPGLVMETNGTLIKVPWAKLWRSKTPIRSLGENSFNRAPPIFVNPQNLWSKQWHIQICVRGNGTSQEKYECTIVFTNHWPTNINGVKSTMFSN